MPHSAGLNFEIGILGEFATESKIFYGVLLRLGVIDFQNNLGSKFSWHYICKSPLDSIWIFQKDWLFKTIIKAYM
jgi:hypothetical protein